MSQATRKPSWTWEDYLAWEAAQPNRYELVGGEVHAMGGGTSAHDIICNNLRGELWVRLRGKPCRVHGPDLKVRAGDDVRYPDALIDCGLQMPGALHAQEPVAVFEVLSKSTAWLDQTRKLRAYDATPSIRLYSLISQDDVRALIYRRDGTGRLSTQDSDLLETLQDAIALPGLDIELPLAVLYEGLSF